MKQLLIEQSVPELKSDITLYRKEIEFSGKIPSMHDIPAAVANDLRVWCAQHLMLKNKCKEAATFIDSVIFDDSIMAEMPVLHNAWLWLARMTLFTAKGDNMLALSCAENALNALVNITNKRSEDFLAIVASLLYCLASVHSATGDNSRAVKELTKAQKTFERLVKRDNARFSPMLLYSVEASTSIFKSRVKQMNIFAHYQTTTELYTAELADEGDKDSEKTLKALTNLVDSLKNEGDLMLLLGNARNAVKFYTKALRYQKKVSDTMGLKELDLSIGLSRALLRLANRRKAAEQLLNSLLPLAQRLEAHEQSKEIEQLLNNRNKNYNIMTMLKGL